MKTGRANYRMSDDAAVNVKGTYTPNKVSHAFFPPSGKESSILIVGAALLKSFSKSQESFEGEVCALMESPISSAIGQMNRPPILTYMTRRRRRHSIFSSVSDLSRDCFRGISERRVKV